MKDSRDSKVHGANMGPDWVLSAPDGPHVGLMNLVVRESSSAHWTLVQQEFCKLRTPVVFDDAVRHLPTLYDDRSMEDIYIYNIYRVTIEYVDKLHTFKGNTHIEWDNTCIVFFQVIFHRINPFRAKNLHGKHKKSLSTIYINPPHWHDTYSWTHFQCKTYGLHIIKARSLVISYNDIVYVEQE